MTRTVLIDGDVLVYKASISSTEIMEWEENYLHPVGNKLLAEKIISDEIAKICALTKCTEHIIALSDAESNFRKTLNPGYKKHRKLPKPVLYHHLRQHLHTNYKVFERPSLEGDDILGILATSQKIIKGEKVIWSIDKDFKTIPCVFYREKQKLTISETEADYNFMLQTLTGDAVDGYCGCKGIGPKTAIKSIGKPGDFSLSEMWQKVIETYEKQKLTIDDALLQARMARILRVDDYDFKTKEVKLWTIN